VNRGDEQFVAPLWNGLVQAPTIWDADTNGHRRTKTETERKLARCQLTVVSVKSVCVRVPKQFPVSLAR